MAKITIRNELAKAGKGFLDEALHQIFGTPNKKTKGKGSGSTVNNHYHCRSGLATTTASSIFGPVSINRHTNTKSRAGVRSAPRQDCAYININKSYVLSFTEFK